MKTVTLYTDGACSGNPGPGGWGAILMLGEYKKEYSGGGQGCYPFSFCHSDTASSSQRLLKGLSAWPFTQWRVGLSLIRLIWKKRNA